MTLPPTADFVIVGGGVVGLAVAQELVQRQPTAHVVVIEKERACGMHASGRNSGVVHAGFYYAAESLKARLTRDGNRRLIAWCEEQGIPVRRVGKLVVARSEADHPALDELLRRARRDGVPLESVDAEEARRIEPRARTAGRALFSPTTAAVDPRAVMERLSERVRAAGVRIVAETAWTGRRGDRLCTDRGDVAAGFVINAAGLHADRIAHAYGFGERYRIVPFKGLYLLGNDRAPRLRTHIYPVPDLSMPFLGVHLTVTAGGGVKIGPTAVPVLGRESYAPLWSRENLRGLVPREAAAVVADNARLLWSSPAIRRHAWKELRKVVGRALVRDAAALAEGVTDEAFDRWGEPGIRAQLYDRARGELEMDFVYEGDDRSLHVLNAVSPAFTCALSLAAVLVDVVESRAR